MKSQKPKPPKPRREVDINHSVELKVLIFIIGIFPIVLLSLRVFVG